MAHLDLILLVAAVNHTVSKAVGEKKQSLKKRKTLHLPTRWSAKTLASAARETQANNSLSHASGAGGQTLSLCEPPPAPPQRRAMSFSQRYLHLHLKNKSTYANVRCLYLARIT